MPVTARPPGLSCRQRRLRPQGQRVIGLIAHEADKLGARRRGLAGRQLGLTPR
jgi:hypothetical protein